MIPQIRQADVVNAHILSDTYICVQSSSNTRQHGYKDNFTPSHQHATLIRLRMFT